VTRSRSAFAWNEAREQKFSFAPPGSPPVGLRSFTRPSLTPHSPFTQKPRKWLTWTNAPLCGPPAGRAGRGPTGGAPRNSGKPGWRSVLLQSDALKMTNISLERAQLTEMWSGKACCTVCLCMQAATAAQQGPVVTSESRPEPPARARGRNQLLAPSRRHASIPVRAGR
jgi:hypothetical protein